MSKLKLGKYQHFKGGFYEVLGLAKDSETLAEYVVYVAVEDKESIWIRPQQMFLENVIIEGKKVPRFKFIHPIK